MLALACWAILSSGRKTERGGQADLASTDLPKKTSQIAQPTVESGNSAKGPPSEIPASPSQPSAPMASTGEPADKSPSPEAAQPKPDEKDTLPSPPKATEPNSSAVRPWDGLDNAPPKSNIASPPSPSGKPSDWKPPVYRLTIEPPWADLEVEYEKAWVSGAGRERQVHVNECPPTGNVRLVVKCDGYESEVKWLFPKSGNDEDISISLDKRPVSSAPEASNETNQTHRRAGGGSTSGFHGITHYDNATGMASFTYNFNDPSQMDDFDFDNRDGASVSKGWLRITGKNGGCHKARFRTTVRVEGTADVSENQHPNVELVELIGFSAKRKQIWGIGAGQLFPKGRAEHVYIDGGEESAVDPVPRWNPKSLTFVFNVRENEIMFSVNGRGVSGKKWTHPKQGGVWVAIRSDKGTVCYGHLKITGVLDPTWIEKNLGGR